MSSMLPSVGPGSFGSPANARTEGKGYSVGPSNGDHWLLYIADPNDKVLGHVARTELSATPVPPSFLLTVPRTSPPDQSLELLMSDLHPDSCSTFYFPTDADATQDGHAAGQALSQQVGISALFDNHDGKNQLDAYLFQPCGYSANLITQQDRYATIHVTPESDWSYASFETNISFGTGAPGDRRATLQDVVEGVLKVFRPGRWSMTLFVSREEDEPETTGEKGWTSLVRRTVPGYRRTDKISYE
jgi:S-adenosylmethionine decarboxylase